MSDRYVFFAFFSFCNFQFYSVFIPLNYHCLDDIFQNLFLLEFSRSSKLDIMLSKLITTATTTFSFYDSIYLFIYSLHIDYYVSSFLFYTNFPIHIFLTKYFFLIINSLFRTAVHSLKYALWYIQGVLGLNDQTSPICSIHNKKRCIRHILPFTFNKNCTNNLRMCALLSSKRMTITLFSVANFFLYPNSSLKTPNSRAWIHRVHRLHLGLKGSPLPLIVSKATKQRDGRWPERERERERAVESTSHRDTGFSFSKGAHYGPLRAVTRRAF